MNDENKNSIRFDAGANAEANDARLNLLFEIGRVLASAEKMNEAAPRLLEVICRHLRFELGELWYLGKNDTTLHLESVWHQPASPLLEKFVAESRQFKFPAGEGLPGKVWAKNAPVWIENLSGEADMPRRFFAEETGLQSGFAFPILLGERFIGAFSFFSSDSRQADDALLTMFAAVGNHVGQFVKRERTESSLRDSEDRYRAFIKQSTEGIWRFELDEKFSVNLPVDQQVELAFRRGYLAECNDAMARMYGLEKAEELVGSRITDLLDMTDAANVEYIRAFIESGYNLVDAESHEKDVSGNNKYFLNSLVGTIEGEYLIRVWGTQRDVTAQKAAAQATRESEESYRIVAQTASEAIIKIDEDSRILFVNSAVKRVFGHTVEAMVGESLSMIMPEELRERHNIGFKRYIETGVRHLPWEGLEITALHADGHTFPLEISFGEYNQDGRRFFIGIARDITDRKLTESRLTLIAEISEMARAFDDPYEFLYAVSKAVGEHLQVKRCLFNEIDFERDLETVHRDYCSGVESVAGAHRISDYSSVTSAEMMAGKTVVNEDSKTDSRTAANYEKTYEPNGERAYITVPLLRENRWVASLWVSDDKPRSWSGQEISLLETVAERTWTTIEKLRVDGALRESEERFAKAFKSSPLAVTITSLETGKLVEVNETFVNLTGYSRAETIGRTTEELNLWSKSADRTAELEAVRRDGQVRDLEYSFRLRDGSEVIGLLSAELLELGGKPCVLTVIQDITRRKLAEKAVRESEERYRSLFETMDEGFCLCEMIFDESGKPYDYRFLEINPAFERMTGLVKPDGKTARELIPTLEKHWFDIYGKVVLTGEARRFVDGSEVMNRWFDVYVSRVGDAGSRRFAILFSDITERRRIERERERFLAVGSDLQVINGVEGYFKWVNPAWERTFGWTAEEMTTTPWREFLHPDDDAGTVIESENAYAGADSTSFENRYRHKDGSYRWLSWRAKTFVTENLVYAVAADVTERKKAEESMRDSEEKFRNLANSISQFAWIADPEGSILWYNERWFKYTGTTLEEMQGWGWQAIHHEDYLERVTEKFKRHLATGEPWEDTFPLRGANGEYRWFLSRALPIRDKNHEIVRWFGTNTDITEQKEAEQMLLERERLALLNSDVNRALIQDNTLPEILKVCAEAVVKHLDAAFARIWTLNEKENVLELQASAGIYTHLDGKHSRVPVGEFKIGTIAAERKPHLTNSVIGDERVGDQNWATREEMVSFAGYPLIIEERLVGVIAMFARQPLTEKIVESLAAVSNAIALGIERKHTESERERLLASEQQAREVAEEANRAKDEFIALVSHELRSPLNAMLGWTRILQNQKPDEKTKEYALDVIVRNARSQSRLIEDLLDIARVGRGKLRLEMEPTELIPIINAAIEIIEPAAAGSNINITRTLDRAADFITGDVDRLRQVVDNLLSNAVKFTTPGGSVEIRLERENNEAKVIVSDTGQGISAEFLPQIFERFKQADPSTTRRHGGLGIGLSLARDLVELHGGTISAESAGEGEGSSFIVTLPLRMVPPLKENSGKGEFMDSQGKLSGFWILAVDDEADARELVSFMLQINGAKVTTAKSAVEALDILKSSSGRLPDVLLSDISMPNESGYALLEKIRALPSEHGGLIPAVALTAFNRPEDREAAFEAGFQKHLGKPVEPEDLISAIIETAGAK